MAQHDMVIDNSTGLNVRSDINSALAALQSCSSGATAPSTNVVAGQLWYNTSNSTLYVRNAANSAWVDIATAVAATYLALTGGKLTGDLEIEKTTPGIILDRTSGDNSRYVKGQTAGVDRWILRLGDDVTEGGAGAGSNFELRRFNDAGTYQDSPIKVTRSNGIVEATIATPSCRIHRSGSGNAGLTANTWTKVALTTLANNIGGGFAVSNNNLRVPRAGIYRVTAHANIAMPNSLGVVGVGIGHNSATVPSGQNRVYHAVTNNIVYCLESSRLFSCAALDEFSLLGFSQPASATVADDSNTSCLEAELIAAQ